MKAIAASVLAFAIIAASGATTYQAAAKSRMKAPQDQAQAEPCIGLSCLPPSPPIKHRPAHREALPPVW